MQVHDFPCGIGGDWRDDAFLLHLKPDNVDEGSEGTIEQAFFADLPPAESTWRLLGQSQNSFVIASIYACQTASISVKFIQHAVVTVYQDGRSHMINSLLLKCNDPSS